MMNNKNNNKPKMAATTNNNNNNSQRSNYGNNAASATTRNNGPPNNSNYFVGGKQQQDTKLNNNTPKVAKASKKLGASAAPTSASASAAVRAAAAGNRPTMEIYKPPRMRHSGGAKSTEDLSISSSASAPAVSVSPSSTKPSAAGSKQFSSSSSSSTSHLHQATAAAGSNNAAYHSNNNYLHAQQQQHQQYNHHQQQQQSANNNPGYRNDFRSGGGGGGGNNKQNWALEREKSKSSKTLNTHYQNGQGAGGQQQQQQQYQQHQQQHRSDDYYERLLRSQTPPPSLSASRQLSCPDNLSKKGHHHQNQNQNQHQAGFGGEEVSKLKRQRSFIKDVPKKRGTFADKEAGEARMILMALEIAQDDFVADWISGNYTTEDCANTVGQVIVQLAIEHNKSTKLITKLSSLLMECNSGEAFHKGLVSSAYRYYECREQLRAEHFRFWLNFVNFLSELHANMGFTYEGELSKILFQLYDYMLQNPILEELKIEELESLISSLINVGYDLERQCPDQLTELRNTLRDAFIAVKEPWARKMILLLIELSASNWKLPPDANEYYFQTTSSISCSVSG